MCETYLCIHMKISTIIATSKKLLGKQQMGCISLRSCFAILIMFILGVGIMIAINCSILLGFGLLDLDIRELITWSCDFIQGYL